MSTERTELLINAARTNLREAVDELRGESDGPVSVDPIDQPEDEEGEPLRSSMVCGFALGQPGETVTVEILGGTHLPVRGLSVAVGVDSALTLVNGMESPELKSILGVDDIEDIKKQRRGDGWAKNFFQIFVGFYEQLWDTKDADDAVDDAEEGKPTVFGRELLDVMIPPMTPLYLLKIKIPEDAEVGHEYALNIRQRYGRYVKSSPTHKIWVGWPPMYATSLEVAKHGITKKDIDLASGWIKVIE